MMLSYTDGAALAADMLAEIEAGNTDDYLLDGGQHNVVFARIEALQAAGSTEAMRGFAAVLSDALASAMESCLPTAAMYREELLRQP